MNKITSDTCHKLPEVRQVDMKQVLPDVGQVGQPLQVGRDGTKGDKESTEQQDADGCHWPQEHCHL